jgi:multidrug resistance efflux pump
LKVRRADLRVAETQLRRLEQLPRPEELPPSAARIREAEARLRMQEDLYRRVTRLGSGGAAGEQEVVERAEAVRTARAQLDRARSEDALLRAGASEPDRAVARAVVDRAQALVEQAETELDRLVVRAPIDGRVLQLNVRPGESVTVAAGPGLVLLGGDGRPHVRVSIDEHDIPRFRPGAPARGTLRGHPQHVYPLTFVRVEPYVVPKQTLTGEGPERVDSRVLRVIYAVEASEPALYVGQLMDVFIAADAAPDRGEEKAVAPVS